MKVNFLFICLLIATCCFSQPLESKIVFESNSSVLTEAQKAYIYDTVLQTLWSEGVLVNVDIHVHMDRTEYAEIGVELMKNRVEAIRNYFISQNLDLNRVSFVEYVCNTEVGYCSRETFFNFYQVAPPSGLTNDR